jgi:hypothetical protein
MNRVFCPACKSEIWEDDPVEQVGESQYHQGCWEEFEFEMENAPLEPLAHIPPYENNQDPLDL